MDAGGRRVNALDPYGGWGDYNDEHEEQFAADGYDVLQGKRSVPMGDMADMALEQLDFDDESGFGRPCGPPEETDDWDDPEPCEGSDAKKMLRTAKIPKCSDDYWIRFGDPGESSSFTGSQGGKYLFFSKYQNALLAMAEYEIWEHGFECAKVSKEARQDDYVLCLYWEDDQRKQELLERYGGRDDIKYRWWKSNADTRAGKYSDQHKRGNT